MTTFNKTQITIGSQTVDVFQNESGEYLYSLTSAANLLQKEPNSALSFIESSTFNAHLNKSPEVLRGKAFSTFKHPKDGGGYYSLVPSWVITKYLVHHATKNGNELAGELLEALVTESLDVRSMRAFNQLSPASYDATVSKTNNHIEEWMTARLQTKGTHGPFQLSCKLKKQPATHVHNVITKGITGKTAAEARQGQLVSPELDPTIGLNYIGDIDQQRAIAVAKLEYADIISGEWKEQAEKAVSKSKKLLKKQGVAV